MVIENNNQLQKAINQLKEEYGADCWDELYGYYMDYICRLEARIKELKESRDNWKKLSMCSRCHKIIEEKRG